MRSRLVYGTTCRRDDRGCGQTGEQVKGTGGRSYVVRHMSKTGRRRLGQASVDEHRHAQQMGSGKARAWAAATGMCAGQAGVRYEVFGLQVEYAQGSISAPAKHAKI